MEGLSFLPRDCLSELVVFGDFLGFSRGQVVFCAGSACEFWLCVVLGSMKIIKSPTAEAVFEGGEVACDGMSSGIEGIGWQPLHPHDLVSAEDGTVALRVRTADFARCLRDGLAAQAARVAPKLRASGLVSELTVTRLLAERRRAGVREVRLRPGEALFSAGGRVVDGEFFLLVRGDATLSQLEPAPQPRDQRLPASGEDQQLKMLTSALQSLPTVTALPILPCTPTNTPRPDLFPGSPIPSELDPLPKNVHSSVPESLAAVPVPQPRPRRAARRPAPPAADAEPAKVKRRAISGPFLMGAVGPVFKFSFTAKSDCDVLIFRADQSRDDVKRTFFV